MALITWTPTTLGDGDFYYWSEVSNWDLARLPEAGDTVSITSGIIDMYGSEVPADVVVNVNSGCELSVFYDTGSSWPNYGVINILNSSSSISSCANFSVIDVQAGYCGPKSNDGTINVNGGDCTFNSGAINGGLIYVNSGTLTFNSATVSGDIDLLGGASSFSSVLLGLGASAANITVRSGATLSVSSSTFTNANLSILSGSTVVLNSCGYESNEYLQYIYVYSGSSTTFQNVNFPNLTLYANASCSLNGSSSISNTLVLSSNSICYLNGTSRLYGVTAGTGAIQYSKTSLLACLNGTVRAATPLNVRYPSNFGAGTL